MLISRYNRISRMGIGGSVILGIGALVLVASCVASDPEDSISESGWLRDVSFDGRFGLVEWEQLSADSTIESTKRVVRLAGLDQGQYENLYLLPDLVADDFVAFCGKRELAYIPYIAHTSGFVLTICLTDTPDSTYNFLELDYSDLTEQYPLAGRFALNLDDSLLCMEVDTATILYRVHEDGNLTIVRRFGRSMAWTFTQDGSELLIWQRMEGFDPIEPYYVLISYSVRTGVEEQLFTATSVRSRIRCVRENDPVYFTALSMEHIAINVYKWERGADSVTMITDIESPFEIELFSIIGDSIICPIVNYAISLTVPAAHRTYKR